MNKKIELQLKITEAHLQFHKNEEMFLELVKKLIDQQTQLILKDIDDKNLNQMLNNFNNTMGLLERNQVMYNKSHDRFLKMNLNSDEDDNDFYPQKLLSEAKEENINEKQEKPGKLEKPIEEKYDKVKKKDVDDSNLKEKYIKKDEKETRINNDKFNSEYKIGETKNFKNENKIENNNDNKNSVDFEDILRQKLQRKINEMKKNEAIYKEPYSINENAENFNKLEDVNLENNVIEDENFDFEKNYEQKDENSDYDKENLLGIIISSVAEMTGYPESIISEEMDLKSDLGFDSLKIVELINLLESKSIIINQKEIALMGINIKTITDLADAVIILGKKKLNM